MLVLLVVLVLVVMLVLVVLVAVLVSMLVSMKMTMTMLVTVVMLVMVLVDLDVLVVILLPLVLLLSRVVVGALVLKVLASDQRSVGELAKGLLDAALGAAIVGTLLLHDDLEGLLAADAATNFISQGLTSVSAQMGRKTKQGSFT
jgi:hypothetical protein